jgi:hypothetical protein
MNPKRWGIRFQRALQEKDVKSILKLVRLAMRDGKRDGQGGHLGWRSRFLVFALFAMSMGLFLFAGDVWAWMAFALFIAYFCFIRIPRRIRLALDEQTPETEVDARNR